MASEFDLAVVVAAAVVAAGRKSDEVDYIAVVARDGNVLRGLMILVRIVVAVQVRIGRLLLCQQSTSICWWESKRTRIKIIPLPTHT